MMKIVISLSLQKLMTMTPLAGEAYIGFFRCQLHNKYRTVIPSTDKVNYPYLYTSKN